MIGDLAKAAERFGNRRIPAHVSLLLQRRHRELEALRRCASAGLECQGRHRRFYDDDVHRYLGFRAGGETAGSGGATRLPPHEQAVHLLKC